VLGATVGGDIGAQAKTPSDRRTVTCVSDTRGPPELVERRRRTALSGSFCSEHASNTAVIGR
jgi:hypothetical protein